MQRLLIPVFVVFASLWQFGYAQQDAARRPTAPQKFRISGTVVSAATDQPLARMEVTISPSEHGDRAEQVVTGADGRFRFDNVSRGKYALSAHGRGFVAQAYQQHGQFSTAIAVGPGLDSENLVFALTPEASISGSVTNEENEAIRSGEAILFERRQDDGRTATKIRTRAPIDDQGRYHFAHLNPGTYFVAISAQPWYAQDTPLTPPLLGGRLEPADGQDAAREAPQPEATAPELPSPSPLDVVYPTTFYPSATDPEGATSIVLHPGERATADVNLHAVPGLYITVHNPNPAGSMPMTLILEQHLFDDNPIGVQVRNQRTSSGSITIAGVPPGHFLLSVRTFTGREWTSLNREIDLSSNTNLDAASIAGGNLFLQGILRGSTGIPAGAVLRFLSHESGESFDVTVNDKGEFQAERTVSGPTSYSIVLLNAGRMLLQSLSAVGAGVAGHTLTVPRSGAVELTVNLSEGSGRVDGVVLRGDRPISETMVLLVPSNPEGNPSLFRRDQTDSDGTFTLRDILPGRYTVVAIEKGWDLDWQNPAVLEPYLARGEVVDITANHAYKISLRLSDSNTAATSGPPTQ
jgi:hypothetical protein